MLRFMDTNEFFLYYLIVNLILTGLNVIFFISRKKENSATMLKLLIFVLLAISIAIFMLNSSSFLDLNSDSLRISKEVLISDISLFLLGFFTVKFKRVALKTKKKAKWGKK